MTEQERQGGWQFSPIPDVDCIKLTGLARNTYYKYKRQIREDAEMKDWLLCRRSRCKSGQKEHGTFKMRMPCSFFVACGGWTTIPSSQICIMRAEKWWKHKKEGEERMKKFLMVLLSIAFVLNLAIVIGLIGGYGSPRRALYTITDELMNSAYRFKRGWQFKNSLPWLFRRWTGSLSIFFCILGLCKRDKNFFVIPWNDKTSHKELQR